VPTAYSAVVMPSSRTAPRIPCARWAIRLNGFIGAANRMGVGYGEPQPDLWTTRDLWREKAPRPDVRYIRTQFSRRVPRRVGPGAMERHHRPRGARGPAVTESRLTREEHGDHDRSMTAVSSLVLFANDLAASAAFFRAVGVPLEREDHGDGPVHWAADLSGVHFAIYQAETGIGSHAAHFRSASTTFPGLYVASLDDAAVALRGLGSNVVQPHRVRPWGCRIVAQDPDGRAIEINQHGHCPMPIPAPRDR
jgi:lactoylglutathione lyase